MEIDMIKCKDVRKQFEGFYALDGVNLNVEAGSVYGLVGPNGAGKSTLIRHLVGIYKQDEGEILIDGAPVYENNDVKASIAYIPDDLFRFGADNIVDMMNFVNDKKEPLIITQNGESRAVLIDVESYQEMKDAFNLLKIIQFSEMDVQAGRTKPAKEVFSNLRRKYNLEK